MLTHSSHHVYISKKNYKENFITVRFTAHTEHLLKNIYVKLNLQIVKEKNCLKLPDNCQGTYKTQSSLDLICNNSLTTAHSL